MSASGAKRCVQLVLLRVGELILVYRASTKALVCFRPAVWGSTHWWSSGDASFKGSVIFIGKHELFPCVTLLKVEIFTSKYLWKWDEKKKLCAWVCAKENCSCLRCRNESTNLQMSFHVGPFSSPFSKVELSFVQFEHFVLRYKICQ